MKKILGKYKPSIKKDKELEKGQVLSLVYHDLFNYPLTRGELDQWTLGKIRLDSLFSNNSKIPSLMKTFDYEFKNGFFFLRGKKEVLKHRLRNEKASEKKMKVAQRVSGLLTRISTIRMIGITGSLAMRNAAEKSDIDLMIIVKKGTLWITRLVVLTILVLLRIPRRKFATKEEKDRLCLNMWFDESDLVWPEKDRNIFTAHEIIQIIPLVNKKGTYKQFINNNYWVKDWWPKALVIHRKRKETQGVEILGNILFLLCAFFEPLAFFLQHLYMRSKITNEVVTPTRALFHPVNLGEKYLEKFEKIFL